MNVFLILGYLYSDSEVEDAKRFLKRMDGTILYNDVVCVWSHVVLMILIYTTVYLINNNFSGLFDLMCRSKIWNWLEEHSMIIYMTHYMFLVGRLNVAQIPASIGNQIIVFVVLTTLASMILNFILRRLRLINKTQ